MDNLKLYMILLRFQWETTFRIFEMHSLARMLDLSLVLYMVLS